MASLLNANYWRKAYLLEFKINHVLQDAFTFSVPPESEDFTFPQRKNETKTFGGGVVADYGNDFVQISLSGSTINQELKLIYKSKLGAAEMTGEQEIFYLRDLLKKYGSQNNLQNKEVYLYSLNGGGSFVKNNPKWWKIYVGQLDITRSKDKPFCYNYKLTAIGNPEVEPKISKLGNFIESWRSKVDSLIKKLMSVADIIEEIGGGLLTDLQNLISLFNQQITQFNAVVQRYADVTNGLIDKAEGIAVDTVALGDKILDSALRYYPTLAADVWNNCADVWDTWEQIYNTCANMGNYFTESYWQSIKELFTDDVSNEDIADTFSSEAKEGSDAANELMVWIKKLIDSLSAAVKPGDTNEDDEVIIVYGYKVVTITDAQTSWDKLALDYYGDASLGYILASVNPDIEELKPGMKIIVPEIKFSKSLLDNEVYNPLDNKDVYGEDAKIEDGDFAVSGSDLGLIGGPANLTQALLNRLLTVVGSRIRLELYGIQLSIGNDIKASSALIQASIHQTILEDPRIESVEDIQFNGSGDVLSVKVVYVDKNGEQGNVGGTIS